MIIYEVMRTIRTLGHGQDLLRIFLRKFQYVSGLSLSLLEYPKQRTPHLERYYYVYLWNFLATHGCQLESDCVTKPEMERTNDFVVTDLACDKPSHVLRNADINKIHYCQSYQQIYQLLDIYTADGSYILDTVLKGKRSINQSASRKDYIVQEQQDNTKWRVLRKFLRPLCYAEFSKMSEKKHFGDWISTIQNSHRLWSIYY